MKEAIYLDPVEVEARLMERGLPCVEELHSAIQYGELHRNSCTRNDPLCLSGILTWGKTVRRLRDVLTVKGWSSSDDNNLPLALNPAGTLAIAVATGDNGTGDIRLTPETKYKKGPAIAAAIEQNLVQLAQMSFSFSEPTPTGQQHGSPVCTWLLLLSRKKNEICSELSLPKLITEKGFVVGWEERIVLPPFPIDGAPAPLSYQYDSTEDDIVVEISRR